MAEINKQYFSGSQVSIFLGDVWLDDITSINYNINDGKKPVFGYGSELYDFVAYGTKLVSGVFTINFREPNYIWLAIERYKELTRANKRYQLEADKSTNIEDAIRYSVATGDKRKSYDLFFNSLDAKNISKKFKQNLVDSGGRLKNNSNALAKNNHIGVDILIGYGHTLNENTVGQKIKDVHIVGQSKTIMQDGRPIQEQYQFFARDLQ